MEDERILLVKNIPSKDCTAEGLYRLFGAYGGVQQIRVGSMPITKHFVIVVYEQCEAARNALGALNGYAYAKDCELKVKVYREDEDKKALLRRKRKREVQAEYKKHIVEAARTGDSSNELE